MDALKELLQTSGDYAIALIPYYARAIAEGEVSDTVRQRRVEALRMLQCQLNFYKKRGYDPALLCSLAVRKAELIMKASTKAAFTQLCHPRAPHYDGERFWPSPYLTQEEELIGWCETSLLAPLNSTAVRRYMEVFRQVFPQQANMVFGEVPE